eukprot:317973-Pyramimonas_sp.AAC.1
MRKYERMNSTKSACDAPIHGFGKAWGGLSAFLTMGSKPWMALSKAAATVGLLKRRLSSQVK